MIKTVSFIGSGNVATQFCKALSKTGITVQQVLSKNIDHTKHLANEVGAEAITDFSKLVKSSDLYIIAVNDDAIQTVSKSIQTKGIVIHTSGSTNISVINGSSNNTGVVWPIKSISKNTTNESFTSNTICVEASNTPTLQSLLDLFGKISIKVTELNSQQRESVHLAAVVANNFSNYMYTVAEDILAQQKISFSILTDLLIEASAKTAIQAPAKSQTGPAARGDKNMIERHLKLLENNPEYHNLYEFVSESIIKKQHG